MSSRGNRFGGRGGGASGRGSGRGGRGGRGGRKGSDGEARNVVISSQTSKSLSQRFQELSKTQRPARGGGNSGASRRVAAGKEARAAASNKRFSNAMARRTGGAVDTKMKDGSKKKDQGGKKKTKAQSSIRGKGPRGAMRGRGRGRGGVKRVSVTKEDLDKELDDYMMKDPEVAKKKLDAELEAMVAQK
eukprot:Nk52_evm24s1810 gene=Nk52_evmTU24s1810